MLVVKIMKTVVFLAFALITVEAALAAKVVCYYASWAIYRENEGRVDPEDLDPNLCTHINYAFVSVKEDGSLFAEDEYADITQGGYKRVVALKEKNPSLKVLLSIGGGSASPQIFSNIAADPGKRAAMVGSARWFMETYNFDGIDLDWEIPESGDRETFVALLQDFRNDFDRNGWLVTAAVRCDVSDGYDVPKISQILDYINIMTYDMYGPWSSYTGQNSPLYASSIESDWEKANLNIDAAVTQWINAGASLDKIIVGIAFYGHTFTLVDPNNNGLHAPFSEGGSLSYLGFCQTINSWDCKWDDEQKVSICLNGDQWLGTDEERSILEKISYINSRGLGGAMIWSVDQDDVHGSCGDAKILLHAVANNLHKKSKQNFLNASSPNEV